MWSKIPWPESPPSKAGKDQITSIFEGPMAIIFVKDDISKSAKILTDHITATKMAMTIKGGFLGNKTIDPQRSSHYRHPAVQRRS